MFNRKPLWIMTLIFLVNLPGGFVQALTIRFHSPITASKTFIELGDIAEISNARPELINTYKSAKLAPSPPRGGQCILDFDMVRNRMLALGLSTGELEFSGPSRILVNAPGSETAKKEPIAEPPNSLINTETAKLNLQRIQAERIVLAAVRNELGAALTPTEFALAEIQVQIPAAEMALLQGTTCVDWTIAGWSESLMQTQHLILMKKQISGKVEAVHVTCEIKMPPKALTVKLPLPPGHVITRNDLDWLYSNADEAETRIEDIVGMETTQSLQPGLPIRRGSLRKKPLVRAQDLVSVYARQGGITVKRTMRAMGTGSLGDTVSFGTLAGNERFTARITGFHEAEILETANSSKPENLRAR